MLFAPDSDLDLDLDLGLEPAGLLELWAGLSAEPWAGLLAEVSAVPSVFCAPALEEPPLPRRLRGRAGRLGLSASPEGLCSPAGAGAVLASGSGGCSLLVTGAAVATTAFFAAL